MDKRKKTYYKIKPLLSYLPTNTLSVLIKKGEVGRGNGINSIINLDNKKIFVKSIPLTQKEYDNSFDTKNLYNLPTYYNYGVGSAGINCWRELIMHIKTTNWVLSGEIENFPLLYHYRIVKSNKKPTVSEWEKEELKDHIKYWGGNNNIGKYILDKEMAPYHIILCLEYIPVELETVLTINMINSYIKNINKILIFLGKKNIIHFDSHASNIVTNGKTIYLTDFGLTLDKTFNLSKTEINFFNKNKYYDYGLSYYQLVMPLLKTIQTNKILEKKYKDPNDDYGYGLVFAKFISDKERNMKNDKEIDNKYKNILTKYKEIIVLYEKFRWTLEINNKKDTIFPNNKIKNLI
jgi:hypothetical protein